MRFTKHILEMAARKNFDMALVKLAAERPTITYASRNHPGQMRHVRGDYVVVVRDGVAITCYQNVVKTPLRKDQLV